MDAGCTWATCPSVGHVTTESSDLRGFLWVLAPSAFPLWRKCFGLLPAQVTPEIGCSGLLDVALQPTPHPQLQLTVRIALSLQFLYLIPAWSSGSLPTFVGGTQELVEPLCLESAAHMSPYSRAPPVCHGLPELLLMDVVM